MTPRVPARRRAWRVVAGQSVRLAVQERAVGVMAALFAGLVLISAWLGWQATATVNQIYLEAAAFLASSGQVVPENPVRDISALSLMRNMSVYVSLIGALAAIVIGNRLITLDRKAGVLPLIGTRPLSTGAFALGKMAALLVVILGLTLGAAVVSGVTFALLPALSLTLAQGAKLAAFYGLSGLYMVLFGLVGLAAGSAARSETVGLLGPVTVWLTLTFIFPQLTANLNPTAAINPIAALAPPPDTAFFHVTAQVLAGLSWAEAYKFAAAGLLDLAPEGVVSRALLPPLVVLGLGLGGAVSLAWVCLTRLRMGEDEVDG